MAKINGYSKMFRQLFCANLFLLKNLCSLPPPRLEQVRAAQSA
jgi:hypothetical protein